MVIFQADGGTFGSVSDEIAYYALGESYSSFKTPTRDGYLFQGWVVTAENNSDVDVPYSINTDAKVTKNLELTATWAVDPDAEPEETEPEGTVPETTAPEETEPETMVPEETVPEETVPETTAPEETEPEENTPVIDGDVELPFQDVPESAWYRKNVEFVYQNGYMNGTSSTLFSPSQSLTRGMLVTVLYRIEGEPEVAAEDRSYFADSQGKYYTDAVGWAKANGIVNGISDTLFGPNNLITRQDAVTIFYRYCINYLGMEDAGTGDLSGFADSGKVSGYAKAAMTWAVDVGLVNGSRSGSSMVLNPKGNLTRAEAAKILNCMVLLVMESL